VIARLLTLSGFLLSPSLTMTRRRPTWRWVLTGKLGHARIATPAEFGEDLWRYLGIVRGE
jgi:hypothetical protein